jgi:hypothetical protein
VSPAAEGECAILEMEWARRSRSLSSPSGGPGSRKVRTPQGRALANGKAGRPDGKWHRNRTTPLRLTAGTG